MCMGNDIQLSALCGLWAKAYPWQKDKKWRMDGYHRSKKGRSSLVDAAQSESFVVLMLSFVPITILKKNRRSTKNDEEG